MAINGGNNVQFGDHFRSDHVERAKKHLGEVETNERERHKGERRKGNSRDRDLRKQRESLQSGSGGVYPRRHDSRITRSKMGENGPSTRAVRVPFEIWTREGREGM